MSARSLRNTHLLLPHALVALSCVLAASAVQAQEKPGGLPSSLANPASVYGVPAAAMPGYLQGMTDATFRSTVKRITPDAGVSTSPVAGSWGSDTRHHYSKDQPWSADGAFYCLENRGGGSPSTLILILILAATAAVAGAADGPRPAAAGLVLARIWPNPSSLPLHATFAWRDLRCVARGDSQVNAVNGRTRPETFSFTPPGVARLAAGGAVIDFWFSARAGRRDARTSGDHLMHSSMFDLG